MVASYTIRAARDAEARGCRMLLSPMFSAEQAPELLVAVDASRPGGGRLVGAAGLATVQAPDGSVSVLVEVVPAWRRRGVGRSLMAAAAARCRGRAPVLRAFRGVAEDGGAAAFLGAVGFDRHDTVRHFEVDTAAFHADMLGVRRRLEAGGRVPAGARVVPLREAPAAEVARLVARHFPVAVPRVLARLDAAAPDAFALDLSVALLVERRVGGALIYNWNEGLPEIEVRVVDPALRGGWANALLLEAATRHGMEAGSVRFRFYADERIADTMSLARRARAVPVKVEHVYWRALGEGG